jgi:hypothetical protein
MTLLVIAALGFAAAYMSIWSAIKFNDTVEERTSSLLTGVLIDVILLGVLILMGSGLIFNIFLICKYIFLSFIDFDKTLRQ